MATTPHMGVTLVEQSQAQKEVTVNMALMRLDALLNMGVVDKDLATPPASPSEGEVYIVADAATDVWAGHENDVAYFEQLWRFINPQEGLLLWVADEKAFYLFDGAGWAITNLVPLSGDGINQQTGSSYSLVGADSGKIVECSNASAITVTLPNNLPQGFACDIVQKDAGVVTFVTASGATLQNRQNHSKAAGQYARCRLYVTENNGGSSAVYVLAGDTQA